MLLIRNAASTELAAVAEFYVKLMDLMAHDPYRPLWNPGKYPSTGYLADAIAKNEFYLGISGGEIAAAMIFNGDCNPDYAKVAWQIAADPAEVMMVHILAVSPLHAGKGHAKAMLRHGLDLARSLGKKAVRLDTLSGSIPAERLYASLGFTRLPAVPMFYENTGLADFIPFEYAL